MVDSSGFHIFVVMKTIKERYLKHEFRDGVFERGNENNPRSREMFMYALGTGRRNRWSEGMVIHNFIKLNGSKIMYHSTVKVGKPIKVDGKWNDNKKDIDDFLSNVPLDDKGFPTVNSDNFFNGEYVESSEFKHQDIVEWPVDKNGKKTRVWVSKEKPSVLPSTNRFEYIKQPTDICDIPYSELLYMLNNKRIIDLLSIRGLYKWSDGDNTYIGSAYSVDGIHSRINDYINNGHGGNKKMKKENEKNNGFLEKCNITILSVFPESFTSNDIQRAEANMKKSFNCTWN